MKKNIIKSKLEFIELANRVHEYKYDYSRVKLNGATRQIEIICPKHGLFKITPSQHLAGRGCPYCRDNRLTREEFIDKINILYGGTLDCKKSTYSHDTRKSDSIIVYCKEHGYFMRSIGDLLKGKGCLKCYKESINKSDFNSDDKPLFEWLADNDYAPATITYPVIMKFTTSNSENNSYLWTEPFTTKEEAENYVENLKLCLEMSDSVVVETQIIEKEQKYLDLGNAVKLIAWLNLASYDAYKIWWDTYRPSFMPRKLHDYYPNIEKMFGSDDVGIVISILNRLKLFDSDDRQIA